MFVPLFRFRSVYAFFVFIFFRTDDPAEKRKKTDDETENGRKQMTKQKMTENR